MFQLITERTVKNWPAQINVPLDGGKVETFDVTFDFKLVDSERFAELSRKGDAEMFGEVIIGWGGIADQDANPLPFTPDNLKGGLFKPALYRRCLCRLYAGC